MNTLTEKELDKRGPALSMGDLSVIEYLRRSQQHEQEHAGDIRKAIRRLTRTGGITFARRILPFA